MSAKQLTLSEFADMMLLQSRKYEELKLAALEATGHHIEEKAKEKVGGMLQEEAGPFDAWQPLAEATKKDKGRQGFVFNADYNPLYRTGDLRASISHEIEVDTVTTGSDSEIMVYLDQGTDDIPARSVFGATMFEERKEIKTIVDRLLLELVTGGSKL